MNAVSNPTLSSSPENAGWSDSDTNPDDLPEYYEPISTGANDDEESDQNSDDDHERSSPPHSLPNGYARCLQNGVDSLDLSDEEEGLEEEEERMREASDTAIRRAFREDESRRNAPLTPENASRVMETMRRISFGGFTPEWAGSVPEDRWINQLRRIRRQPSSSPAAAAAPPIHD